MLQFIRDYAKGFIAWLILILIIVPFALWGINQYFRGDSETIVAQIDGMKVPQQVFQRLFQDERAFRQQVAGENADPRLLDDAVIKRDVMQRLVNRNVMWLSASAAGLRIGDVQLGREIRSIPQFQRDGRFDQEQYAALLRSRGTNEAAFEEDMRRDLLAEQLMSGVTDTVLVSKREIDQALRLREQQRKVAFMVLKADDQLGKVEVSPEEIERYYQNNLERFAVPERVKASYIELSTEGLKAGIAVDEQALRRMYEERVASFTVGEQRRARHILVQVANDAPQSAVDAARTKAEKLLARVKAGESFAELARKNSDDSGSAAEGGELGFFGRGMMVQPFEDAVFSMHEGDISGPVRSPFGFHIIQLEEIKPGSTRSFEEMRQTLADEYREARAEEQFFDLAEKLANLTFEHPDSLQVAAEQLGLKVQTTEPFTQDRGQGIAEDSRVRAAAFSDDVLVAGNNSEPIDLGQNRVVVLRVAEKEPATHRPLDEVRPAIEQELQRQAASDRVRQIGDKVLERLGKGEAIEAMATEYQAEWHAPALVGRNERQVPPEVLSTAFSAGRPSGATPITAGSPLSSGDYAILALYEVHDGDPAAVPEDKRKEQQDSMTQLLTQRVADELLQGLKSEMDIKVYEDRL